MVDSILFPWSGRTILTTTGTGTTPVSGAQLEVFDAGTTNQKTVYVDSGLTTPAANPIEADNAGVVPLRYLGTGAFKITFEDSNDAPLSQYPTWDNVPGALDTSGFLTGSVSPTRPITSTSTNTTLVEANDGQHINADATGADITITLRSAVAMGDGNDVVIKHSGTANNVTVSATQLIDTKNNFILNPGDAATFRSDGGNFHISEAFNFTSGIVTITYAAAITPDFSFPDDTDYQVSLTGNLTVNAPTNVRVGQRGTFTFIQDATGDRTITFNSIFKGSPDLTTTSDSISVVNFHVRSATDIDLWPLEPPALVPTRTLIETQNPTSGGNVLFDNIPDTYFRLQFVAEGLDATPATWNLRIEVSDDNGSTFNTLDGYASGFSNLNVSTDNTTAGELAIIIGAGTENISFEAFVENYTNTNQIKFIRGETTMKDTSATIADHNTFNFVTTDSAGAIDAVRFTITTANTFTGGEIRLYGWN